MTARFDIDEYVDVAERIHSFYERFPDGRLVTVDFGPMSIADKPFVFCHAKAFRNPDDPLPGDGLAWEPVPGPTQFTRDSELMNAQTAAWGRAIVALGFETKKIASRQEVQARQAGDVKPGASAAPGRAADKVASPPQAAGAGVAGDAGPDATPKSAFAAPPGATGDGHGFRESRADSVPDDDGQPHNVKVFFGKNAGRRLGELTATQLKWYAETWTPDGKFPVKPEDRRLRQAARMLAKVEPVIEHTGPFDPEADIPF